MSCLRSLAPRAGGYENLENPPPVPPGSTESDLVDPTTKTSPTTPKQRSKREKSAERTKGRRSNPDAPPGHGHHHSHSGPPKPDTVLCPTCRGQGKVPKEKERHLVALIPADDERLQPSKTKTYVFIAVVSSLLLAFLTIFFIYPRSFNLQTQKKEPDLYPIGLYINTSEQIVRFNIQNWWFLRNPNYYPIHLTNLNVQAYMNKLVSESSNVTVVTIPMRSKLKIYATLTITFKDDLSYLVKFCNDDRSWVHTIFIRFQATAVVNIMGYNFTSIAETYQKVSCGRDKTTTVAPVTTPTTTIPTTTSTSTTTPTTTTSTTIPTTTTSTTTPTTTTSTTTPTTTTSATTPTTTTSATTPTTTTSTTTPPTTTTSTTPTITTIMTTPTTTTTTADTTPATTINTTAEA